MSILTSNELFINMKNVPKYDPGKHFFDQSKDVLQFYLEEFVKITEGVNIGGYFVHPWLYYHINFFHTPIPKIVSTKRGKVSKEVPMPPPLDDNAMYVIESYKQAEDEDKGLCMFGTRGFAKTTFLTSHSAWKNTTIPNGVMSITGGNSGDLGQIKKLYNINAMNINRAFTIPRLVTNWEEELEIGVKYTNNDKDIHSILNITNAEGGTTEASSEKGAGGSPIGYIIDEIGKFEFKKILDGAKPSFFFQGKSKLTWILSGTGGNEKLSRDAREVLANPKANDLIMMNWDRLDRSVPEEAITWESSKSKPFSIFVPGQMSYRMPKGAEPAPKLESTLDKFLGKDGNRSLKDIKINVTDWPKATKSIESYVQKQTRPDEKERAKSYYPTQTEHCFITSAHNPFPIGRINARIDYLEKEKRNEKKIEIISDNKGWYEWEFSEKQKAQVHHQGGIADSPVLLFDQTIPEQLPERLHYVSGLDAYKTAQADTDSLGAFYVVERRALSSNLPFERIVASYSARPERMRDFHNTCEKLHNVWNAQVNYENIDTGFEQYLDEKNRCEDVLAPYMSFAKGAKTNNHGRYGTPASSISKQKWMNLVIDHATKPEIIGYDDDENPIEVTGIDYIDDIDLLKEMRDWTPTGNFDRLVAWGHALLIARHYDNLFITTEKSKSQKQTRTEEEMRDKLRRMKNKYGGNLSSQAGQVRRSRY